ncbi:MAG TPA: ROK family protein, partial [Vicinamibacteria bacterium]|nr:ROK family protein [Vicinamibacteria bacterium]
MRIGVDLGGTKIEGIALGPGGVEQGRRRVPTPRDDYEATVETIARVVE